MAVFFRFKKGPLSRNDSSQVPSYFVKFVVGVVERNWSFVGGGGNKHYEVWDLLWLLLPPWNKLFTHCLGDSWGLKAENDLEKSLEASIDLEK